MLHVFNFTRYRIIFNNIIYLLVLWLNSSILAELLKTDSAVTNPTLLYYVV